MGVNAAQGPQLGHRAVLHEPVAQVGQRRAARHPPQGQLGQDPAPHAPGVHALLRHQHPSTRVCQAADNGVQVQRDNAVELEHLGRYPLLLEQIGRPQRLVEHSPVGDQSQVRAGAHHTGPLQAAQPLEGALPPFGVAHRHRAGQLQQRVAQHGPQLGKAGRAQHPQAGDGAEVGHVKHAMMGLAVLPHQPRPVHGKDHVQSLDGHVVDEHIVGAL